MKHKNKLKAASNGTVSEVGCITFTLPQSLKSAIKQLDLCNPGSNPSITMIVADM